MISSKIKSLHLKNYRNFQQKHIELDSDQILITGDNGSGKTSILEAISLLTQGKGLRGEKFHNQIKLNEANANIKYDLESYIGDIIIDCNFGSDSSKRILKLNDKVISSSELLNLICIFWIIPQQNTLFHESQVDRRKFYDRIVHNFEPNHASNINKYEHYQRERLKILSLEYFDPTWLDIIEEKLADLAIIITADRLKIQKLLNDVVSRLDTSFPKITIKLKGRLEELFDITENKAQILSEYKLTRDEDIKHHRTHFGAMKTDFTVIHNDKNISAEFCSTGEHQACLISLLIAQTVGFMSEYNKKPTLLLDELFVHLDDAKKNELTEFISKNNIQTIVTTTEPDLCLNYSKMASVIKL